MVLGRDKKIFLLWVSMIFFLAGATFIAYRGALQGGLVWDAGSYLLNNPYIMGLSWENIKWMFSSFFMSNWHPLTWLSYTFDYLIYTELTGIALTNILLHCANTILIFFLASLIIKIHRKKDLLFRKLDYRDLLSAFIAALLFGIHPQHVESVAWLAERKDVLCLFFILLTFILYINYAQAKMGEKHIYYWTALLCFLLASLSKPMAVTVPVLLLIGDIYPLGRVAVNDGNGFRLRREWPIFKELLLEKIPFLTASIMLVMLTLVAQKSAVSSRIFFEVRALNALKSLIIYISKFVFPVNLMPLYQDFPKPDDFFSLVPVMAVILMTAVFIHLWLKGQRYWLAAWLFYIIALLPMIGLVQVGSQSSADRYAYLPTIPFYILAGIGFSALLFNQYIVIRVFSCIFLAVSSFSLLALTQNQIAIWKNDFSLWNHIAQAMPDHGMANSHLGDHYFYLGQYEKSVEHYYKAAMVGELVFYSFPKMAISLLRLGRLDEALNVYTNILRKKYDTKISNDCIYYNIGLIHAKQGALRDARQTLLLIKEESDFSDVAKKLLSDIQDADSSLKNNHTFSIFPFCERFRVYTAGDIYDRGVPKMDERY